MDDNNANAGSFMAPAGGGGSALAEAMQRRGLSGGGVLNNNTSNPQSVPISTVPAGAPSATPQGGMPMPSNPQAGMPDSQMPPGNPEVQKILSAMDNYLKSVAKINETQAGVMPPQPSGGK